MNCNKIFEFLSPAKSIFEVGGTKKLGKIIASEGWKNAFIAGDKKIVNSGLRQKMR